MMIEMPRDEWDINVATLADGLPIVHRLENRQQPRMLLHQPCDGIQVASASMRSQCSPSRRRGPRGLDRGVNISRRSLRNRREFLSVRRIDSVEVFSRRGCMPSAADEMLEAMAMTTQPCHRFFRILWSGPVFHAHKLFGNAHLAFARFLLP